MTQRNVSLEAVAMRAQALNKALEQQALILQDDLLIARREIEQYKSELGAVRAELETLKGASPDGNQS